MSNTMSNISFENVFTNSGLIISIFLGIVGLYIIYLVIKKLVLLYKYKLILNIFPKLTSRNIANIAMVIAISIAIIVLLTVLSAGIMGVLFRVYPSWRSTIEGILIKIGGLLFGPIVGLFIGAATDILTVTLTAGMFHYGYFISALAYGFFSGMIRNLFLINKKNKLAINLFISLAVTIIVCSLMNLYLVEMAAPYGGALSLEVFNIPFKLSSFYACLYLDLFAGLLMIVCWVWYLLGYRAELKLNVYETRYWLRFGFFEKHLVNKLKRGKNVQKSADKLFLWQKNNFTNITTLNNKIRRLSANVKNKGDSGLLFFIPVIIVMLLGEQIIDLMVMPVFDQQLGGGIPLNSWLLIRVMAFPFVTVINIIIIYPSYKAISGFIVVNHENSKYEKRTHGKKNNNESSTVNIENNNVKKSTQQFS
ncbi:MAG: hypothetical protein Ta2E_06730 [Mycoplasmoidaceae bacterium]|nr:MAG: hypothetical protein Ta2E_06730 [Mycoplasmoidaceae bacterium]